MNQHPLIDTTALTVWDYDQPCTATDAQVILWRQFATSNDPASTVSICNYVEKHATEIRPQLLEFIYEVGEAQCGAHNLKTQLKFKTGFSYFWMTHFHSRPYTQSGQLNNIAKVFALREILGNLKSKQLIIHSRNRQLIAVLKDVAKHHNLDCEVRSPNERQTAISSKSRIKLAAPKPFFAVFAIWQQFTTARNLQVKDRISPMIGLVSFFDYWYRLGPSVQVSRKFQSQYWTNLVNAISGSQVNWIHKIVDQRGSTALREASSLCADFNNSNQHHFIIDANNNPSIIFRSLRDYFRILVRSFPLRKYRHAFVIGKTDINLWPLLRCEWRNSLRGYEAMANCLRFNSLDAIVSKLPRQRVGIYLMENQPWEMAMIHLWRQYGHGQLIGVAHSTVRFWDLRFMSDPRSFFKTSNFQMPRPDLVAINGPLARKSLLETNYPENELVDVEALMYLHLARKQTGLRNLEKRTILVATDFLASATRIQMKLLDEFLATNNDDIRVLLKPHWSQTFNNLHPRIEIVSGKEDLATFFDQCDVMYCSSITSAVIDGVCAGLPVIQCLDPESFNLSPLRGHSEIQVVRTGKELGEALRKSQGLVSTIQPSSLFNLDPNLSKWHALIGNQANWIRQS